MAAFRTDSLAIHPKALPHLCLVSKICALEGSRSPLAFAKSLVAQTVRNLPAMWEPQVGSLSLEDSPGEGSDYPLQGSCWENPMDRGAGRAPVHGVARNTFTFLIKDTDVVRASPFPFLLSWKKICCLELQQPFWNQEANRKAHWTRVGEAWVPDGFVQQS